MKKNEYLRHRFLKETRNSRQSRVEFDINAGGLFLTTEKTGLKSRATIGEHEKFNLGGGGCDAVIRNGYLNGKRHH